MRLQSRDDDEPPTVNGEHRDTGINPTSQITNGDPPPEDSQSSNLKAVDTQMAPPEPAIPPTRFEIFPPLPPDERSTKARWLARRPPTIHSRCKQRQRHSCPTQQTPGAGKGKPSPNLGGKNLRSQSGTSTPSSVRRTRSRLG